MWKSFWRLQLALEPAGCLFRFQRIRPLAIEALERAPSLAARRKRQNQIFPAVRASRSFSLAHGTILPRVRKSVNFKLGHCGNQIRPLGVETGQYPALSSLSAPRATIFGTSSGNGRCSALARFAPYGGPAVLALRHCPTAVKGLVGYPT